MKYVLSATITEGSEVTEYKVMMAKVKGYSVYKKSSNSDGLFPTWQEAYTGFKDLYTAGQALFDVIHRGEVLV